MYNSHASILYSIVTNVREDHLCPSVLVLSVSSEPLKLLEPKLICMDQNATGTFLITVLKVRVTVNVWTMSSEKLKLLQLTVGMVYHH